MTPYQSKLLDLKKCEDELVRVFKIIALAASSLSSGKKLVVSNLPNNIGFPPEITLDPDHVSIIADEWPSAEVLGSALANYYRTFHEAEGTWNRLPPDQRIGIRPPVHIDLKKRA